MPRLGDIATLRAGTTLRGRDGTRPDPKGEFRFIRIGDVDNGGEISPETVIRIQPNEPIPEDHWLRSGDVLVPSRGQRTTAAAFRLEMDKAIVGPQFFVARPKAGILPEYLAWFLRSEPACRHFEQRRKGTYVQILQRGDVAELEVPIPPLRVQELIVALDALIREEARLSDRLVSLRAQLNQGSLLRRAQRGQASLAQ